MKRGRPRIQTGTIRPWQFARNAMVQAVFDEIRAKGEKHKVAIRETAECIKGSTGMKMSERGVSRILSQNRPKWAGEILRYERLPMPQETIDTHSWILQQLEPYRAKGLNIDVPTKEQFSQMTVLAIRVSARPDYPRHNRKEK